ncbi:MAG: methylene-tetrahydromethanopterin dehydrogenase N-terminal domain-containing protein [Gemmatimonadota bacterium]
MRAVARILIHLDHNPHPRVFDSIMSIDGGADYVLSYGDVDPQDVPLLVSGALYSRPEEELSQTAVLITGTNDRVIEEMVRQARRAFFGRYRVSVMSECKGGNAVAAAAVARIAQILDATRASAVVVGGGPVGARVAGLLIAAGTRARLTVFDDEEAEERRRFVGEALGQELDTVVWKSGEPLAPLLEGASIVVTAGPPGLILLPRHVWEGLSGLELLVDVSGAEPSGIEGLSGEEDGELLAGSDTIRALGGLAISRFKIRIHREAVGRLFETNPVNLGPLEIAALGRSIINR